MDWSTIMLIASLIMNALFLNIIVQQARDISVLRRKIIRIEPFRAR
ncbi:hypothetical protein M467_14750 [Exiguobacterium chiriqhucha RW-2]|uniref:Uncharacterized protein n=1 Tax=Exiguobacterium chiriqhucha RW-2 TaxID=1345023 RepID=U1LLS3_9BACL|nr:hypothetical protein M467_14750 [Exiguobacterium chiriqhucha RW-2]